MSLSKLSLSPFSKPSSTLSHFNRLAGSASGTDRLFMVYAYGAHVLNFLLRSKAISNKKTLDLADRVGKLGTIIAEARMLYRLFGIFPIISWAQSLNDPATTPKDKYIANLQRAQAWSMLIYYPLEHVYYMGAKGILDISPLKLKQFSMWSCRFWAAYVALQFLVLKREYDTLSLARAAVVENRTLKLKAETVSAEDVALEKTELARIKKKDAGLKNDLLVQIGYLPLTMHWSLPNGLLPDPVWVGLCGTLAAVCGLRGVWRATA